MRVDEGASEEVYWFHTDDPSLSLRTGLGSTSLLSDIDGEPVPGSQVRYFPYGEYRTTPTADLTDVGFTGHRETGLGLIYMRARFYLPGVGRFASADTIVPDHRAPQLLNRFTYAAGNPVKYTDPSGHIAWLAIGALVLKAIDWGWTAWDTYQSGRVLADPDASAADKMMAGLNVALAGLFELIEPDDLLPIGLPADDVARRTVMEGAQEAFESGGREAAEGFLRGQLGSHADDVLGKLDELVGIETPSWRGQLRYRMEKLGSPPTVLRQAQAHHDLPWKWADWFAAPGRGLDVNDVQFGRWVDQGAHTSWSRAYELAWDRFIELYPDASRADVLKYLDDLLLGGQFPSQ